MAALEGHDADIPTEDQTAIPKSATTLFTPGVASLQHNNSTITAANAPSSTLSAQPALPSTASSSLEKDADLEAGGGSSTLHKKQADTEQKVVDPNIVDWDGPDDPRNPVNWSSKLKWENIAVISTVTFLTYAPSAFWTCVQR